MFAASVKDLKLSSAFPRSFHDNHTFLSLESILLHGGVFPAGLDFVYDTTMLQAKLMQVGQTEGYHLRGVNGSTEGAIAASPVPTWTSADATAVALGVAGDGLSCSAGAQKPGNVTITINAQSADGTPLTLQFNQPVGVPPANSLAVDFDNPTP